MPEIIIEDGQVKEVTLTSVEDFIEAKRRELQNHIEARDFEQQRIDFVLSELEKLIIK